MDNSTAFSILELGPSMATDIFHQCLVRSQPFAGTHRFLALVGLFTFLSRRLVVNPLRASERNWFRTVILTTKKKASQNFLHCKVPRVLTGAYNRWITNWICQVRPYKSLYLHHSPWFLNILANSVKTCQHHHHQSSTPLLLGHHHTDIIIYIDCIVKCCFQHFMSLDLHSPRGMGCMSGPLGKLGDRDPVTEIQTHKRLKWTLI